MLAKWEEGWACLFGALDGISEDDLARIIHIRNEGHTVLEAINRQLAHYPYHVGQIVHIGKMLRGDEWKSLSRYSLTLVHAHDGIRIKDHWELKGTAS
jgi:hypothetical protein